MPTRKVPRLTASSMAPAWAAPIPPHAMTPSSTIDRNFFITPFPSHTVFATGFQVAARRIQAQRIGGAPFRGAILTYSLGSTRVWNDFIAQWRMKSATRHVGNGFNELKRALERFAQGPVFSGVCQSRRGVRLRMQR